MSAERLELDPLQNGAGKLRRAIPSGWYCVGYSDELRCGCSLSVRYFETDWTLSRTDSGAAVMQSLDQQRTLHLRELQGFIFAWYHPEGGEPAFEAESIPDLESERWVEYLRRDWQIETHVQETGENGVDTAHFHAVHHSPIDMSKARVEFNGHKRLSVVAMSHQRVDEEGHIRDKGDGVVAGEIHTVNVGPGQTWTRNYGVDLLVIGLPTPIERDRLILRFACTVPETSWSENPDVARLIIDYAFEQVEQDIPIWNHKVFLEQPILCDGDGPIARYRRWFEQFYA